VELAVLAKTLAENPTRKKAVQADLEQTSDLIFQR
jgi:hypothetical protein